MITPVPLRRVGLGNVNGRSVPCLLPNTARRVREVETRRGCRPRPSGACHLPAEALHCRTWPTVVTVLFSASAGGEIVVGA